MIQLNFYSMTYLFFRLSPFIIASFFSLSSIFNGNFRGFIYLVGLVCSCAFISFVAPIFVNNLPLAPGAESANCSSILSIGLFAGTFSKLPLSLAILSYTLFYLSYTIAYYNLQKFNIVTLLLLPALIIAETVWNSSHGCFSVYQSVISVLFAGGLGALWSYIVQQYMPNYQYFNTKSTNEVCVSPSADNYTCYLVDDNGTALPPEQYPTTTTST